MTVTPFGTRAEYDDATAQLQAAASAYYDSDTLLMDDATYDELVHRVAATVETHPEWGAAAVLTEVAGGVSAGGDIAHSAPMLSLDNVFSGDELRSWCDRLAKVIDRPVDGFTVEPKLDGLALAVRYESGVLSVAATRGDGRTGEDVTVNVGNVAGLPATLPGTDTFEVRGEVFMTDSDFEIANANRVAAGGAPFANPRNAAAGTLRSQTRTYEAPLTFAAYQVVDHPDGDDELYGDVVAWLEARGFNTAGSLIGGLRCVSDHDDVVAAVDAIAEARPTLGFAIDGAVIKANSPADRADAGSNSRAPRWGIAYKYPADTALTRLIGIEIVPGRTGLLTPRAVLEPVSVGGTTITSATLHNPGEVERLDIRIGDMVWVMRAGEVIPRVTGPNVALRVDDLDSWVPPTSCPRCGSGIDKSEKRWRCERGRDCNLLPSLEYWCSRDCLDIEGAGETVLAKLIDAELVGDIADLYALTADDLASLDRMGSVSAANLVDQIERSKSQPLARVFCGLGMRYTGRSMSRRIAAAFGSMAAIRAATVDELAAVDGIGPVRAESITAELVEITDLIDRLATAGVSMADEVVEVSVDAQPWAGKKVVVSGSVPGLSRNEANEWVERLGGKSSGSVSKNTDLLVAGDGAGSKLAKAEQLGVDVMSADEFAALVAQHS